MKKLEHYYLAVRSHLCTHINKRRGYSTDRKIIVIESDDWGSIRMPSRDVLLNMADLGLDVVGHCYNENDSLATEEDLSLLFEVLLKYKDHNGNFPKITANTCMANPDFEKIKASDFRTYYYEPFTTTLKRYPHCSFGIWKEGIARNIFVPQFHGREHLNVEKWMYELRKGNEELMACFDLGTWGIRYNNLRDSVVNAFVVNSIKSIELQKDILYEGMQLFREIFGYTSKSFIAPCYTWSPKLNETLKQIGVEILQGGYLQYYPKEGYKNSYIHNYLGKKNNFGQVYLVRNCLFEPTLNYKLNKEYCLNGIQEAFSLKKPAIISAHRLNFIGSINLKNRDDNLRQFSELLQTIVKRWPEVEFMSSSELGEIIGYNK